MIANEWNKMDELLMVGNFLIGIAVFLYLFRHCPIFSLSAFCLCNAPLPPHPHHISNSRCQTEGRIQHCYNNFTQIFKLLLIFN